MKDDTQKYPEILSLKPEELISWCNNRRREMNISKSHLAELTDVPESTLDRILSGKNPEFRYSTIQPIVSVLIGYHEETPEPDVTDSSQNEFYYNTIEGYKLVVENKNHTIEELKKEYLDLQSKVDFFRTELRKKEDLIKYLQDHIDWLKKMFEKNN